MENIIKEIENLLNQKVTRIYKVDYSVFKNEFYIGQFESGKDFILNEDLLFIYEKSVGIYSSILSGNLPEEKLNKYIECYDI